MEMKRHCTHAADSIFCDAYAGYEILNSQLQRYLPPPVCGRNVRLIRVLTTLLVLGT